MRVGYGPLGRCNVVYAGTILRDAVLLSAVGVALRFSFSSTSLGTLELMLIRRAATDVLGVDSTELVETRLDATPTPGLVVADFPSDAREVDAARDVRGGVGVASDGRAVPFGAGGPIFPMTLARTLLLRALRLARGAIEGVSDSLPSLETSDIEEGGRDAVEGVPIIDSRLIALTVAGVLDVLVVVAEFFIAIFLLIC